MKILKALSSIWSKPASKPATPDATPDAPAEESPVSSTEVKLVQESWAKVVPISDTAAELFYGRLFEVAPEVKPLFKGNMQEQGAKLMKMVGIAVNGLNDLPAIVPAVQDLGRRHVDYGVKDEHYAAVGNSLLWTLGQGLGDDFTPDTKDAWAKVYGVLADTMIAASKDVAA